MRRGPPPNFQDYLISGDVTPTMAEMDTVEVKVSKITLDTTGVTLSSKTDDLASVKFSLRKYALFTPEAGAGAIIGSVKAPKYGTGMDAAGHTIVAPPTYATVSVNPVVSANFVCRCGTGWLTPLIQIGAAASKDTPALLTGVGLRLFGVTAKTNVALAGGVMYAWVKDLQKLHVGSVISGTSDIDSDLGFRSTPRIGAYMSLQFNF